MHGHLWDDGLSHCQARSLHSESATSVRHLCEDAKRKGGAFVAGRELPTTLARVKEPRERFHWAQKRFGVVQVEVKRDWRALRPPGRVGARWVSLGSAL